ncbi:MAG: class I SAM-dependent methyltransferase [Planctomycetota bacterium]
MKTNLDESVAHAMEADVRLLPVLPELLADLWEFGPSAREVADVLASLGVPRGATILDLACGKGAVSVALAEQLGASVRGIDAFQPFLDAAKALAVERGVADRCVFEQGDIRGVLGESAMHDVVVLLSVGPLHGDYVRTVAGLRTLVRAGGYLAIEDGFRADDGAPDDTGDYTNHAEMLRQLTAHGEIVVREVINSAAQARRVNQRNTELISQRARLVKERHPALASLVDAYVERQERETERLGTDVPCALWVLQRT